MSEETNIEWATSTGNPWGPGAPRFRTKGFWKDALKWNRAQHNSGAAIVGEPRPRIFPSLCDWLDEEVPIEWLADFLKLIHDTPNLDWLLLTKRPEKWYSRIQEANYTLTRASQGASHMAVKWLLGKEAPANVWIGVSVEDKQRADERIPQLLPIPAKVRFLSVEPLLEAVDLRYGPEPTNQLHWVIVGGESGPGARPCNVDWIRSIVVQCKGAGVPCFIKQLGSVIVSHGITGPGQHWPTSKVLCPKHDRGDGIWRHNLLHKKGRDPAEWPADLRVREFPC